MLPFNARANAGTQAVAFDQGLRSYMLKVYNLMALALVVTGVVAFMVGNSPQALALIFGTPLKWVVMLAPLGFALFFGFKIHSMQTSTANALFWVFSALMGLSMASIFALYTQTSIAKVFFITASVFGAMSLYGYTTKKDLTSWGSFLFMGVIGLVLASLVNIWLKSPALDFALSIVGVLLFVGLTAYDTQKIRETYYMVRGTEMARKMAIMGAFELYLDFINLFVSLMRLFGERR